MKRGKGWSRHVGRLGVLSAVLVLLAACNDFPMEGFQVQNDSRNQAFVIITTYNGRNIYAIPARSAVVIGAFDSQDGDVEVLGPTCEVLATFGAPETQVGIFNAKTSAWLGNYQITIPQVGTPTVANPNTLLLSPEVRGAVLDPTKTDPSVCPPVTVPGALPQ